MGDTAVGLPRGLAAVLDDRLSMFPWDRGRVRGVVGLGPDADVSDSRLVKIADAALPDRRRLRSRSAERRDDDPMPETPNGEERTGGDWPGDPLVDPLRRGLRPKNPRGSGLGESPVI